MPCTPNEISRHRHWVCALQIAERRRELGLTQQDVVDRLAAVGVAATNRTLSAMEHGQGLDVGRLPELAAALDCTVTYLLGLTADPHHWVPDEAAPWATGDPARGCTDPECWFGPATARALSVATRWERNGLHRFAGRSAEEAAEPAARAPARTRHA